MKRWRARFLLLAGAAGLAFALPAAGQRDREPESLLPPGFGDPAQPPPKKEEPPAGEQPGPAPPPPPALPEENGSRPAVDAPVIENAAVEDLEELDARRAPPPIEIPDEARRPTDAVGPLTPADWGLEFDAFGNANGFLLTGLMSRLDAPLPSRWTSILLRRALLSHVPAPRLVNEVDWVAERAALLLRMGEADAARMLVQSIDVDRFTPRMFTVAVDAALATADPAGLCPLVEPGRAVSDQAFWPLADAMCAALEGEASRASQLMSQSRRRLGGSIDLLLAEKVVGAGTNTRRAVTIEWEGVDNLDAWRFGLASATGLKVPDALLARAGPRFQAWQARAPMVPLAERLSAAHAAATLGVFSHAAMVEMYSLIADATDPSEIGESVGGRLGRAYAAPSLDARMEALRGLWDDDGLGDRYSRQVLTASAAARVVPSETHADSAADLIGSMMTAGFDRQAARWGGVVEALGDDADRAWSILAVGAPRPVVDLGSGRVAAFAEGKEHRGRMLVAALAGLGRYGDPAALGVDPAPRSRWAQMIALAAERGQTGTVALLAGVGMQTGGWRGVPPHHLYHALKALRQVGREYEARMIAAEAMTRL